MRKFADFLTSQRLSRTQMTLNPILIDSRKVERQFREIHTRPWLKFEDKCRVVGKKGPHWCSLKVCIVIWCICDAELKVPNPPERERLKHKIKDLTHSTNCSQQKSNDMLKTI